MYLKLILLKFQQILYWHKSVDYLDFYQNARFQNNFGLSIKFKIDIWFKKMYKVENIRCKRLSLICLNKYKVLIKSSNTVMIKENELSC